MLSKFNQGRVCFIHVSVTGRQASSVLGRPVSVDWGLPSYIQLLRSMDLGPETTCFAVYESALERLRLSAQEQVELEELALKLCCQGKSVAPWSRLWAGKLGSVSMGFVFWFSLFVWGGGGVSQFFSWPRDGTCIDIPSGSGFRTNHAVGCLVRGTCASADGDLKLAGPTSCIKENTFIGKI